MKLTGKKVLLTGATGGIGRHIAIQLAARGATVALVCHDAARLNKLVDEITQQGGKALTIVADFSHAHAVQGVVESARHQMKGMDILINNAGVLDFIVFEQQDIERIAQMVQINLTVPMQLTRALLPDFIARNSGQIVNIGSIFGSIGFPYYASYSATKFGLRGFSQALRRELQDRGILVTYVAPRAVQTSLNDTQAMAMLKATKTRLDDPAEVASRIVRAIECGQQELYIGQPESFFAWLNGLLPRLVSQGLKKQTTLAYPFALRK
jgi:short-subunit dehydrogenase